eukprot:TRINITY_DN5405_c1_g1_i1.p1 TRINITY_DN5405_c1_g1~~TRINITY_DN5405_c1_g1_i1.p1  ORF type:complete len:546 (+),score=30.73 TRINITY_DN5405_c1_g1_i1:240-1640(+)
MTVDDIVKVSDKVVIASFKKTVSLSAVNIRGSSGTLYVKGKRSDAPWIKKRTFTANNQPTLVYLHPYPTMHMKFELDSTENFSVESVKISCNGCRWAPEPTAAVTPTHIDLTLQNPTRVEALGFDLQGTQCDPQNITILTSSDGNMFINSDSVLLSSPRAFPHLSTQIVYIDPVDSVKIVRIAVHNQPCAQWGFKAIAIGDSCTGGLPSGVDQILVSHYKPATERQLAMEGMLRMVNMQASFRDSWTRDRVIREKAVLSKLWKGAPDIAIGEDTLEWVGGKKEVWKEVRDGDMRTRKTTVHKAFLGRVANMAQHFSIYEEFYQKNVSIGLVLEDDSIFVKQFPSLVSKIISEAPLPTEFDVIFLGGCLNKHASSYGGTKYSSLLWNVTQHRCANGYLVTRRFLEKMLFSDWPRQEAWMNIDGFLESRMETTIPRSMWAEPPIIYEASKALWGGGFKSLRQLSNDRG